MRIATEGWFRGSWRVARLVTGRHGQMTAAFAGTCRFEPDSGGLACHESGVLRCGAGRYPSRRTTLWRFPGWGRIEVHFDDGRPFHAFKGELPEAVHVCGSDRYEVAYAFERGRWFSRWVVRGPAKDYVIHTRYRRA